MAQRPQEDLIHLEGMSRSLSYQLASRKIFSLEDLANQGIDELSDIEGLTDKKAGELIMAARNICWFST
jgi:N utilization substance protein A